MPCYRFCEDCDNQMDSPSLTEAMAGFHICPSCQFEHKLSASEREQVVEDFQDRFERMEKFLSKWMPKQ